MALDLRTETEKERDKRHAKVISDFRKLKEDYPQYSDSRLLRQVAKSNNYSHVSVYNILKKHEVIK